MTNQAVQQHFSQLAEQGVWASLYQTDCPVTAETWSFLIRARRVVELLQAAGVDLRDLLDVGCGTAPLARSTVAMGATYTGVDFSAEMIQEGLNDLGDLVAQDRVRLEVGDATSLAFPAGSFDAVLAMGVLEYLTRADVSKALREAARVLRPGGVAVLTIPKRWNWGQVVYALLYPLRRAVAARPGRSLKLARRETFRRLLLTPGELDRFCAEAGLRKVDQRHYNVQLVCRPATQVGPRLCYFLNRPLEGLARVPGGHFLATGYIGMYRRDY